MTTSPSPKEALRSAIEKESKPIFMSLARLYVNFGPAAAVQIYDTLIVSIQELRKQALEESERFKKAEQRVNTSLENFPNVITITP